MIRNNAMFPNFSEISLYSKTSGNTRKTKAMNTHKDIRADANSAINQSELEAHTSH